MIFKLDDTNKVKHIFEGWNETLIFSCLQKVMGKIYVTEIDNPKSAFGYELKKIEVDTLPEERRKHLATVVCSALILNCLEEGLYPSWDAQNMNSVQLAKKLGYEYDHEYIAYEGANELRTH